VPQRSLGLPVTLLAMALAGCGAPLKPLPSAQASETAANECGSGGLGRYVSQLATDDTLASIRAAIGHGRIRTIRPGDAVTMDFRPERLNIEIGGSGRIERFRCG